MAETQNREVLVRKAPKFLPLILSYGVIATVVAIIISNAFPDSIESAPFGRGLSQFQAFGYMLIICLVGALVLAGITFLILDRLASRSAKRAIASRESLKIEEEAGAEDSDTTESSDPAESEA